MSGKRAQRAPLLSSVVMVLLATVATGLLVMIGFQGLPATVVPSTFHSDEHETRYVDVTGTPAVRPTPRATTGRPSSPAGEPPSSTRGPAATPGRRNPGNVPPVPGPPKPTVTTPPKTTAPSPTPTKVTPSPTRTSPAPSPSPSPTCTRGRGNGCPKSSPKSDSSYSRSSGSRTYSGSSYAGSSKAASPGGAKQRTAPAKPVRKIR